jgi:hypothetical protein
MLSVLVLTLPFPSLHDTDAQQISMYVSASNAGRFFGAQIVQVLVEGASIRNTDTDPGPITVNGLTVPLVHLSDSRWAAFFADTDTFTTLASVAGFSGSSIGDFWVLGPDGKNLLFPSLPNAFGHDAIASEPKNPNLDLDGDCPAVITALDPCVDWPYIRLFSLNENDQVSVRYGSQSVTLDYVKPSPDDIILRLDRDSYPINAEIIFGLSDYMWNINPVEEDQISFVFGDGGSEVFYQASISLQPVSLTGLMRELGFDSRQVLLLQGKQGIRFTNAINGIPATILIETFPNVGAFENFNIRADMFASERDVQFRFDYFDKSISAGMGTSDASISVGKEEPKTGTKIPEVKEEEPKINPYSIDEPKLVDLLDRHVSNVSVEQTVLVQTRITNNLDQDQPFTYIVQVKDSNELTVMLTWIKGSIYARDSFNSGISWTPESKGDYSIEVFVWKNIDELGTSPLTRRLQVSVS